MEGPTRTGGRESGRRDRILRCGRRRVCLGWRSASDHLRGDVVNGGGLGRDGDLWIDEGMEVVVEDAVPEVHLDDGDRNDTVGVRVESGRFETEDEGRGNLRITGELWVAWGDAERDWDSAGLALAAARNIAGRDGSAFGLDLGGVATGGDFGAVLGGTEGAGSADS